MAFTDQPDYIYLSALLLQCRDEQQLIIDKKQLSLQLKEETKCDVIKPKL
jgi:hypothetical protein